ncbi:MAG: helix-turn-helix domain-containing protein [Bacteroidales bacterium]|nr:helix-turn-helix domain-containing protein [Clostridium sp.]MCM1204789.1 helix-turn-helix domain-containing protein [Bacteroidales bacterium]
MKEERYLIKEAAAKVGVEAHVLRYWEEELRMDIHRNEMGHRYYTGKDIEVLSKVRDLKDKGLQLKAIRNYLEMRREQIARENAAGTGESEHTGVNADKQAESGNGKNTAQAELVPVKQKLLSNEEKMEQFQQLMNRILSSAIQENNDLIGRTAGEYAAGAVVTQFQGMTKEQEARAEERYQKLDRTLREIQQARLEAAAANMRPVDRRKQKRLKRKQNQPVPEKSGEEPETEEVSEASEE